MEKLISWTEIPALDIERAVKFYNTIFSLDLQIIDCNNEKMACFPNDEGAISLSPGFRPSTDGVLVSFNAVDEIDRTLADIKINGGKIIRPKTKIEAADRGYFALFIDCEGNKVGLYGNR